MKTKASQSTGYGKVTEKKTRTNKKIQQTSKQMRIVLKIFCLQRNRSGKSTKRLSQAYIVIISSRIYNNNQVSIYFVFL